MAAMEPVPGASSHGADPHGWHWPAALTVCSGRQALSLVARWCRAHAITTALLPAYHCETMATPFWLEAMAVRPVAVDGRLQFDPAALHSAVDACAGPAAILTCRVGAMTVTEELAQELSRARQLGHLVVEDATHSLLDELIDPFPPDLAASNPEPPADIRIASLRKLLPVPDGAWITTAPGITLDPLRSRGAQDEAVTRTGLELLEAQHAWRAQPIISSTEPGSAPPECAALLTAMARADAALDATLSPAPAGPVTLTMLARIDLPRWALAWRRANSRLCSLLAGDVRPLNAGRACFPLIRSTHSTSIDKSLAAHGAFAPQYWSRPSWLSEDADWPEDVLSIDVAPDDTEQRAVTLATAIAAALVPA